MNNYKVYRISGNGLNYIGSTGQDLNLRLKQHINAYNRYRKNGKSYCSSFKIINGNNYSIECIEEVDNVEDLKQREKYHIKNSVCINMNIPSRDSKEYYLDNQVKLRSKYLTYYYKNLDNIREKRNSIKINCSCGSVYNLCNTSNHLKTMKHNLYCLE